MSVLLCMIRASKLHPPETHIRAKRLQSAVASGIQETKMSFSLYFHNPPILWLIRPSVAKCSI